MPKSIPKHETEVIAIVARDTGILDLRVFVTHPKRRPLVVGTATLRMEDLRQVVPLLTKRLQIEELYAKAGFAAGKPRKGKQVRARSHFLL